MKRKNYDPLDPPVARRWAARRSGAGITIDHALGKTTNVASIRYNRRGMLVAEQADGSVLHLGPAQGLELSEMYSEVFHAFLLHVRRGVMVGSITMEPNDESRAAALQSVASEFVYILDSLGCCTPRPEQLILDYIKYANNFPAWMGLLPDGM